MSSNKRYKIDSAQYLEIFNENNNFIPYDEAAVKKRPHSPLPNETNRIVIKTASDEVEDLAIEVYNDAKKFLHNVYETVSQQLSDVNLKLSEKLTIVKIKGVFITWCCCYNVKWPQSLQFKKSAPSKKKVCHEAALSALLWLRKNGNITRNGEPIIPLEEKSEKNIDKLELYGSPKHVLHNTYYEIATKLNNKDLQLEPTYIKKESTTTEWCCKYSLKWPELKVIEEVGQTKREASQEAALSTLLWLKNNSKITETGHPIISIEKSQAIQLNINSYTWDRIKAITKEYNDLIATNIKQENFTEMKRPLEETGDIIFAKNSKQRYLGSNKYLAKERTSLPITRYKEHIISLLQNNRIVVIKGEPGCGKSTCVPQYALEAWIKQTRSKNESFRIAVTQPRRIAAISLAERVSFERDEQCGLIVGYHIRLNSNFDKSTGRILYCTSGILLRHLQSDPSLENFPCVILDEAHERDANTDLLMLLLRKSLELNPRFRIIIMSATIDTDLFKNYFDGGAAVLQIEGLSYPVKNHFLEDLPVALDRTRIMCQSVLPSVIHEDVASVILYVHINKNAGTILCFLPGWDDISRVQTMLLEGDLMILCLHSKLQDSEQAKIFWPSPPGLRKVILATNIAETSVTINDVVYVIDTGIHKESRFCDENGVLCLDNQWISQASMIQRKGRAGRVQAGESFHLYTRSKFESMQTYTDPEILKISLTKIVLDAKAFYDGTDVWDFMENLPTPPKRESVLKAVQELKTLELFDDVENLTELGKILAQFQLQPKLSKAMVNAVLFKCVTPIVDIVTIFSSETEMFNNVLADKLFIRSVKEQTGFGESDHLALMTLFEEWLELLEDCNEHMAAIFSYDTNLNHNNLFAINEIRRIHFSYLENGLKLNSFPISDDNSHNTELVKCVLYSGLNTLLQTNKRGSNKIFLTSNNHEATITSESVNFKKPKRLSTFFTYISEIRSKIRKTNLIRECSRISPLAILLFSVHELQVEHQIEDGRFLLSLKDTPVKFLCMNEEEANDLRMCKMALNELSRLCINKLTRNGEPNEHITKVWDNVLKHVDQIFSKL